MDLGLTKQHAAERLGVWCEALRNWERTLTQPGPKHLPAIRNFLGTEPIKPTGTLGERLRAWRKANGLSKAKTARLTGLHEQTIANLERGGGRWMSSKVRAAIRCLLDS